MQLLEEAIEWVLLFGCNCPSFADAGLDLSYPVQRCSSVRSSFSVKMLFGLRSSFVAKDQYGQLPCDDSRITEG